MDALVAVDELGDVDVAGDRDEGVGLLARHARMVSHLLGEERNHVAHGNHGSAGEVLIEAHGDVVCRCLSARPEQRAFSGTLLMNEELEGAGQLRLHGGDVDLAVALAGVAVAGFEERSFGVHGDEERGAFDHLLVVHVAGVDAGGRGVEFTGRTRRRDAHCCQRKGAAEW